MNLLLQVRDQIVGAISTVILPVCLIPKYNEDCVRSIDLVKS